MKLCSLKNEHRWHLYLSGPTIRCPSDFDGVAEGKKLSKKLHMDQWVMDVRKRDPFYAEERHYLTIDFWWDDLETDDIVFEVFKELRKHYGIETFDAELDQVSKDDDSWEFPIAFYKYIEGCVQVTTMSAEEVYKCACHAPPETWYAIGTSILACRDADIPPGIKFCYHLI